MIKFWFTMPHPEILPPTTMHRALGFAFTLAFALGIAQAQWSPSSGPQGASIQGMAAIGEAVLVGTSSGLLRSTDQGRNWSYVGRGMDGIGIKSMALVGLDYYAGTWLRGIWKRTAAAGDQPWVQAGLSRFTIDRITGQGPFLFATDYYEGVFRSADGGATWDTLFSGKPDIGIKGLVAADGVLCVGTKKGIYRSGDNGNTWTAATGIASIPTDLAAKTGFVYAILGRLVYRSSDQGATWSLINTGFNVIHLTSIVAGGEDVFVGTSNGEVFRSTDNGDSWVRVQEVARNRIIHNLALAGSHLFASFPEDVYRSPDKGATWTQTELLETRITGLAALDGDLYAASWYSGIHRSSDNGANWTRLLLHDNPSWPALCLATSGNQIFAGTFDGVWRSRDRGATWDYLETGFPQFDYMSVEALAVQGSMLFAGTHGVGAYRSLDSGRTWRLLSPDLAEIRVTAWALMGRTMVAGATKVDSAWTGRVDPGSGGLHRSVDGGVTWHRLETGMDSLDTRALLEKDGLLFAGMAAGPDSVPSGRDPAPGVYRSMDSGATWTRVGKDRIEGDVSVLISLGGAVIAGTRHGAFRSLDNGDSWTSLNAGLDRSILSLAASGPYLVAGLELGSAWRLPLDQVVSVRAADPKGSRARAVRVQAGEGGRYDVRGRKADPVSRAWKSGKKPRTP